MVTCFQGFGHVKYNVILNFTTGLIKHTCTFRHYIIDHVYKSNVKNVLYILFALSVDKHDLKDNKQ